MQQQKCFLDAKFWVGRGVKPSPNGLKIPDENGKEVPLRRYDRKTIVLTLPGELTVFDIGHFGVWCEGKFCSKFVLILFNAYFFFIGRYFLLKWRQLFNLKFLTIFIQHF